MFEPRLVCLVLPPALSRFEVCRTTGDASPPKSGANYAETPCYGDSSTSSMVKGFDIYDDLKSWDNSSPLSVELCLYKLVICWELYCWGAQISSAT